MCSQNEYPLAYTDFLYRNYQHKYKVHPRMYEIHIFDLFTISVESGNKFQSGNKFHRLSNEWYALSRAWMGTSFKTVFTSAWIGSLLSKRLSLRGLDPREQKQVARG